MLQKILLIFFISLSANLLQGQNLHLEEYEIYIGDTIINKTDFLKNGEKLDNVRLALVSFKPIADGQKRIFYLNGQISGEGKIKNKKETGLWVYWHENGRKAREGNFNKGKRIGKHTYWYPNGKLRAVGHFKNDAYDGKWTIYTEDSTEVIEQIYKNGKLITQK